MEGFSIRHLHQLSGLSPRTLRTIITTQLAAFPPPHAASLLHQRHLIFDGTFLVRRIGIVCFMETRRHSIIAGQYHIAENSEVQLRSFFSPLHAQALDPLSCTVDGNPQVMRVLTMIWPNIIIQRCLVHIQRQGLMWCRAQPKRAEAQQLRKLFLLVTSITTFEQRDSFLQQLDHWDRRYGQRVAHPSQRGWVASDLRRARSMLINALPNMFHYLTNASIPRSTNGLEGYFARLKSHYRPHRGLALHKRSAYFQWYFFLRPR